MEEIIRFKGNNTGNNNTGIIRLKGNNTGNRKIYLYKFYIIIKFYKEKRM